MKKKPPPPPPRPKRRHFHFADGPPKIEVDDGSYEWSRWLDDTMANEKEGTYLP